MTRGDIVSCTLLLCVCTSVGAAAYLYGLGRGYDAGVKQGQFFQAHGDENLPLCKDAPTGNCRTGIAGQAVPTCGAREAPDPAPCSDTLFISGKVTSWISGPGENPFVSPSQQAAMAVAAIPEGHQMAEIIPSQYADLLEHIAKCGRKP